MKHISEVKQKRKRVQPCKHPTAMGLASWIERGRADTFLKKNKNVSQMTFIDLKYRMTWLYCNFVL